MVDFWNFKDSWIVVEHNWLWMLVALGLGTIVGWRTSDPPRKP
jgi:hypothetical protein